MPLEPRHLVEAATRTSEDLLVLDGEKFYILDLPYADLLRFNALISPLKDIAPDSPDTASRLLKFLCETVPKLARIVCAQTNPSITEEELKKRAKNPFTLLPFFLAQVLRNSLIPLFTETFKTDRSDGGDYGIDDHGNPLLLVDGLCQGYHWPFDEPLKRTMPQIIMLNHAAYVNHERAERRWKKNHPQDGSADISSPSPVKNDGNDPVVLNGKRVSELNEAELDLYFKTMFMDLNS